MVVATAGEHRRHQVPLGGDHRGRGEQAADDREDQADVERRKPEPVSSGELRRAGDPPGVDEQQSPAQAERDQGDLHHPQGGAEGDQADHPAAPDQREQRDERQQHPEPHPDPQRDPADPTVAGGDLGRARQHQRHPQEREPPAQLDPLAALLRGAGPAREVARVLRGTTGHAGASRSATGYDRPGPAPADLRKYVRARADRRPCHAGTDPLSWSTCRWSVTVRTSSLLPCRPAAMTTSTGCTVAPRSGRSPSRLGCCRPRRPASRDPVRRPPQRQPQRRPRPIVLRRRRSRPPDRRQDLSRP